MRILVTGSRDWRSEKLIEYTLDDCWRRFDGTPDSVLVSGACPTGADAMAEKAWEKLGMTVERHPANWDDCDPDICDPAHRRTRNGKSYCPRAGFTRNRDMVRLGADICLAFIRNESKGATMTAQLAQQAGITTLIFREQA